MTPLFPIRQQMISPKLKLHILIFYACESPYNDCKPNVKWAVSLVIALTFLRVCVGMYGDVTDCQVVRVGVSVTWSVLSWSGGHEFASLSSELGLRSISVQSHTLTKLTLKVLNFWKFTSYCSLKPLWSGIGEVVPARTLPTLHPPSPPTVHQLSRLAL